MSVAYWSFVATSALCLFFETALNQQTYRLRSAYPRSTAQRSTRAISFSDKRSPIMDRTPVLDNLSAASAQASEIIKSSCPDWVPLTPIGRMDAAEQRLDATIKAIQMVLSPLERFYETLSDEQRERFNAMNGLTEGARSPSDMATLCSQEARFIDVPAKRVEEVVQPTAQQRSAFDDLKKAAQKVGDQLRSSCPTAVPKSLVARLETIETRLSAIAEAIKAIRPNLKNFYASLSDEQRARFNMMGQGPLPASPPQ